MPQSLPRRWSIAHNPLSGLTFAKWWKLLRDNRFDVDLDYAHRALFLSMFSAFNSICAVAEHLCYSHKLCDVRVRKDPIFILGHWRSGTTHLHNLMACDGRLAAPTTFQVVNPSSFLITQRILPRLLKPLLPVRRPMDNMTMSFDAPQEDELALSLLSGMSLYMSMSFPRRAAHYDRFMTFADVPDHEVAMWKQTFVHFVRKLSLHDDRRWVFKSPAHTSRIRLLMELFPDARFIHVYRDPYTVFQSSRHYFATAAWYANLQVFDPAMFDAEIIRRYDVLHDAYLAQRSLIPAHRLHEFSYESLDADPIGELRRLYAALELEPFAAVESKVQEYLVSIADYRKNQYHTLNEDERRRVAAAWGRYFQAFGYPTEMPPPGVPSPLQEAQT